MAVCVATYRRPLGLARLLNALGALEFAKVSAPEVRIVVVDNDSQRSALQVCTELRSRIRWPLTYEPEPRRGIPQARNRALACVGQEVEFIAFIDDDDIPDVAWLDELLSIQRLHQADVVAGPAISSFEAPVPDWMRDLFNHARHPTGTQVRHAGTGNVLIRTGLLRERNLAFDERLALTGGEDTHFFLRLARLGALQVWADEAVVHEWVPRSRMTVRWALRRAYRAGVTWSFCECDLDPSLVVRARRTAKGVGRIAQGCLLLPFALLRSRRAVLGCLRHVFWGVGNLSGLLGIQHDEYRQVQGQ